MHPTLRTLLDQRELDLRLVGDADLLREGALDAPLDWAHASDLADPTPFLDGSGLLLTTGRQFEGAEPGFADAYVARLVERGVAGLGFGTEVLREGTPDSLVAACRSRRLPLVEVPYRTPFIAIARTVATGIAEEAYARRTWALGAQRALALAALRPDGLSATLAELSRQLGQWVALVGAGGRVEREYPAGDLDAAGIEVVRDGARELLRRGQRASVTVQVGPQRVSLHTLGIGGALRGVLAVGGADRLDRAGRGVMTAVIAMAGLALEQHRHLDRTTGLLRTGLLHALLAGDLDLPDRIARQLWGPLPAGPVHVAVASAPESVDALVEWLELEVDAREGALFFACDADRVVLCTSQADRALVDEVSRGFRVAVGVAGPVPWGDLARGHDEARRAHERATESRDPVVVTFDAVARQGVLAYLARTDAREVAHASLDPLVAHDAAEGTALVATLRTWLERNGHFDAAARALGVHRHTVRARIQHAERLLGRDLSTFHARADLWAALLAAGAVEGAGTPVGTGSGRAEAPSVP
ncbi:PucR family transcriptional regulator [Agromyces rhizosphaerae]|uniref:PucR family transcriptional regulator n=1 Tax=Agromyces rhizosphaerae TaxID=88374 RepID=A0A9W6CWV6_9MICO|nr:PucR family transcriptional regulator ligand-binding domain-containing protein [Agromyces rhizosphaerae]GLI26799.1 PucR family transcriptional regulator [Agromyces rhizosphaerae]